MECTQPHAHTGFHELMSLVGTKWTIDVLHHIRQGANRFGLLKKAIPGVSSKTLTERLRTLEQEGLIAREVLVPTAPQHVEYALTEKGSSLGLLIRTLDHWPGGSTNI